MFAIALWPLANPPPDAPRQGYLPYVVSFAIWYAASIVWLAIALHCLASALERCDIAAAVIRGTELDAVNSEPRFVWICALPPASLVQANQLCKHLRKRFAHATIGVGLWNADRTLHKKMERMRIAGAQRIAMSLTRAVQMTQHR